VELKIYTSAISDFNAYIPSNPNNTKAILLQGYAFLKSGDREKAKSAAERVIQLDPAKEVYFSGDHLLGIYNIDLLRAKAKQLTNEAQISISERSSYASKALANMKLNDAFKDLDSAWYFIPGLSKEDRNLKDTIKAGFFVVYPQMKAKPEISETIRKYVVQATNATQDKKYDEAINLWATTLNMAPYFPMAYYNRALLYEMKGQIRDAISDMENYVKLVPDASDARSAKDKIYAWEAKVKDVTEMSQKQQQGAINHIESEKYSPGNFVFAFSIGGGFGVQIGKNPGLEKLWSENFGTTSSYKYTDKMPFLYSGNMELVVKPVRRIGIGAFGNWTGGIGCRTTVSGTKYMMNMGSMQYGGLIRYYMILNNGAERPDFYIQYAYGLTKLSGDYSVATMDGIIYNYSYVKDFKGSAPYYSIGVGMGGKINKLGYLTLSLDYINSKVKNFTTLIVTDKNNTANQGTKGTVAYPVNATYNGFELKFLFGFCL
jgi:tetratricopeptide (TPR) repeat protein